MNGDVMKSDVMNGGVMSQGVTNGAGVRPGGGAVPAPWCGGVGGGQAVAA